MSIENNLASIAASLAIVAKYCENQMADKQPVPTSVPAAPVPTPVPAAPVPIPVPAAPVPTPVPAAPLPFHDQQSLMAYVMTKYKELGPAKGGLIQGVLSELGISHVSALTPDHYQAFYLKVEAL